MKRTINWNRRRALPLRQRIWHWAKAAQDTALLWCGVALIVLVVGTIGWQLEWYLWWRRWN